MSTSPKLYLEKRKDKNGHLIVKDCLIKMYISIPDGRVEYYTGIRVDQQNFIANYLKLGKDPISVKSPNFGEDNDRLIILVNEANRLRNLVVVTKVPMTKFEFKESLDMLHRPKRNHVDEKISFIDYLELLISQREKGIKVKPKTVCHEAKLNI